MTPNAPTSTSSQSPSGTLEAVDLDAVVREHDAADGLTLDSMAVRTEIVEAACEADRCATLAALTRDSFAFERIDCEVRAHGVAETQATYTAASLRGTYQHTPAFQALGELTDRLEELARNLGELGDDVFEIKTGGLDS